MDDEKIQALNAFVLDIDCLEELDEYLSDLNFFEILKIEKTEIRHSNFLAWLLNPNENHGFGCIFLRKLLMELVGKNAESNNNDLNPIDIAVMDFDDVQVYREKHHIDILVVSEANNIVFAIENKICSDESDGQTEKYRKSLLDEFGNDKRFVLLFLTPDGVLAQDENWIPFQYSRIVSILETLVKPITNEVLTKSIEIIKDYIKVLKKSVVEDKELKEKCIKLYQKHKVAIDLIVSYIPDERTIVRDKILERIRTYNDYVVLEEDLTKYLIRFVPAKFDEFDNKCGNEQWLKSKHLVAYEIQIPTNGAICLKLILGPSDYVDLREKIKETIGIASNSSRWTTINNIRIGSVNDLVNAYDDCEYEKMYAKIDKQLQSNNNTISSILELLKEKNKVI